MKKEQETYARRSNVGAPGVMERAAVGRIRSFRVQDQIVRASPGCRRPLFRRSVACVTEGVCVVPVVARLWKEDGRSSLRRLKLGSASTMHGRGGLGCCRGSGLDRT